MSLQDKIIQATEFIQGDSPFPTIRGAVVLGSGLGEFADTLQNVHYIPYSEIPHFHQPTIAGHAGRLAIGEIAPGFPIACMQGRFHFYEGHDMDTVVFPTRVLQALGASFLIVTNAAGGINLNFKPGALMIIEDHLNLMGDNPLRGANPEFLGPRFLDMTEAYAKDLRQLAQQVAQNSNIHLERGVYAGLSGPNYETPAEVRMLRTLGADAVGMSTVPEVIAANHMGMNVLGISCITNAAAGISGQKLNHQEVTDTAEQTKLQFVTVLNGILNALAAQPALSA
jgi:purine-nucleoside phosphorylase